MTLAPTPGSYAAIYYTTGAQVSLSNEAMNEVNCTDQGIARYKVYEITAGAKRYLNDTTVPTFEADTAGNGVFVSITPASIEYAGGRIVLSSARGSTDVVRCASGYYIPVTQMFGAATLGFVDKTAAIDITAIGDDAVERYPGLRDWEASFDAFMAKKCAEYSTSGGNANSHVRLIHTAGGTAGNSITIKLTDPGGNDQSLSVSVVGSAIDVSLATGPAGAITTTANQLMNALNASLDVLALNVRCLGVAGETGAGVVAALDTTNLAGGLEGINFDSLQGSRFMLVFYDVYSSDSRHEGYGILDEISWSANPQDVVKCSLKFSGARQPLYWRAS